MLEVQDLVPQKLVMEAKKIKIFVDGHVFDKEFQGTQTFLKGLYTELIKQPTLEVYFGAENLEAIVKNFPELPLTNILGYKKRRFGALRFLFDIPFFLEKHQFDFAHFQYIIPKAVIGCKYIVTTHDVLFNDFKSEFSFTYRLIRNLIFKWSFKNAAIKTTVSHYSKQQLHWHYQIPLALIHVIPNGVKNNTEPKASTFSAAEFIQQKRGIKDFILYVSRIEPRKNHLCLLKKYLKLGLDQQGISLVFIGQESIPVPALSKLIRNLSKSQQKMFHWIDQVEQQELDALYTTARLFVYPSKAEGFGIPPLEAAIHNCAVLCSTATAMKDFQFFEPYNFDPNNEDEFEQKLAMAIQNPPNETKKRAIAEHIGQNYNWQNSSRLFYNLLTAHS